MADESFSPTFLRSATAYGVSARLRGDLVVNNLTGYAFTTGEVMMKSDGKPWRPLVHIEDIARAFMAVMEAPRELVHNEAFNVGASENYRVREVADLVAEVVPEPRSPSPPVPAPIAQLPGQLRQDPPALPGYQPKWTLRRGIEQLHGAYREAELTRADFFRQRYMRLEHVKS